MAANSYGFDFLRTEHNLDDGDVANATTFPSIFEDGAVGTADDTDNGTRTAVPSSTYPPGVDASHKSNLEKQADVLVFLRQHRSSGCLPPAVIYKALGIDLSDNGFDHAVVAMLSNNPKVVIEVVPDPENPSLGMNTFGYRAKFSTVKDRATLLAQINRMKNGIRWNDLVDAYDDVEQDMQGLLRSGEVLGVANVEEKDRVLFPRGESFLVEMDGCVTLKHTTTTTMTTTMIQGLVMHRPVPEINTNDPGNYTCDSETYKDQVVEVRHDQSSRLIGTDIDPRTQIRRGEAIRIGGEWHRVSSEIRPDLPVSKQPPRAQAPCSVVSMKDLSRKNDVDGYCRKFDSSTIPLDGPLDESVGLANLSKAQAAREKLRSVAAGASTALLSSFVTEKSPSLLVSNLAKSVAASLGIRRGGGAAVEGAGGDRKRPSAKIGVRRPGDGGGTGGGGQSSAAAGGTMRGKCDAEAVKVAVENARHAASDQYLSYSHAIRHGCTKDVREMYLETLSSVPQSEVELHKLLLEHKLIDPGEKMTRPRMKRKNNVDNDGKPKKRRYYERKNMRRTNTHLDGTEIGAMLAMAAERQAHGNSVGDGGM